MIPTNFLPLKIHISLSYVSKSIRNKRLRKLSDEHSFQDQNVKIRSFMLLLMIKLNNVRIALNDICVQDS